MNNNCLIEEARNKINHFNKHHPVSGCCCGRPHPTGPTGLVHPTKSEKNEKVPKIKGNGTQFLYTNFA